MMNRFFLLVVLVGIGIFVSKNVDIAESWQKARVFLETEFGIEISKNINIESLEEKRESLETKLTELTNDLVEKVEEGTAKYKEIETAVIETKEALEETQRAIENLQDSTEKSKEVLGL